MGYDMPLIRLAFCVCIGALLCVDASTALIAAEDHSYRLRDENRMEGFKDNVPSSSLDLRVVSFLSYREDLRVSDDDTLKIGFYVPSADRVFITAREIVPLRHYFMEPVRTDWPVGWHVFAEWPAGAILVPERINLSNLGIIASLDSAEANSPYLVPTSLYSKSPPKQINSYKLHIVSRESLSIVRYGLKRYKDSRWHSSGKMEKQYFTAETPVTLTLDLTGEQAGWFELWIEARVKNRIDGPRRHYFFFHQPTVSF